MKKLLAGILLLVSSTVLAAPNEVEVGKWVYPATINVCDTPDQILEVVTIHANEGLEAAAAKFSEYNKTDGLLPNTTACGNMQGVGFIITSVLLTVELDGTPVVVAEVGVAFDAENMMPIPQYTALFNAVVKKEVSF